MLQSHSTNLLNPITVKEIYNITQRNYPWESFKYVLPTAYHSKEINHITHDKPQHKKNYIDDVLKIKKNIPSPNLYQIKEDYRPLSGKMSKGARKTLVQAVMDKSKAQKIPGPGAYFNRPKTAEPKLNRPPSQFRQHYLHEVQYLSSQNPGVGSYNINYFKGEHIPGPKIQKQTKSSKSSSNILQKTRINRKKAQKSQINKTVVIGTFDWIAQQSKSMNKNFFGKSNRFTTQVKQKVLPGPNNYTVNNKWSSSTNMFKTCSSFSNIKTVYYH